MLMLGVIIWISLASPSLCADVVNSCEAETFKPSCSTDEVVVMETAKYGRMKLGRCASRDYGYIGCNASVLQEMDNKCSGRRLCEIRLPDPVLDELTPCPNDFKTYLETTHTCVPVHNPRCRPCRNITYVEARQTGGYLSSIVTQETSCGGSSCPYLLKAGPGQRLNITLWDFSITPQRQTGRAHHDLGIPEYCYRYAILRERYGLKPREKEVCGSTERVSEVLLTETHAVEVEISQRRGSSSNYFLLQYQVIGCADYTAPINSWAKREEDETSIGCVTTGKVWKITCKDGRWIGAVGSCPEGPPMQSSLDSDLNHSALPLGILIAVIMAIAMIIGVLILTIGLVFIKRKRAYAAAASVRTETTGVTTPDPYYNYKGQYNRVTSSRRGTKELLDPISQENEYEQRYKPMEMRPLPPLPAEGLQSSPHDGFNTSGRYIPSGTVPYSTNTVAYQPVAYFNPDDPLMPNQGAQYFELEPGDTGRPGEMSPDMFPPPPMPNIHFHPQQQIPLSLKHPPEMVANVNNPNEADRIIGSDEPGTCSWP